MHSPQLCSFEHHESFEVLDIFKDEFKGLIDKNIISIKCHFDGISTYVIDINEHDIPIGIKTHFLQWNLIFNEDGKYPFPLDYMLSTVFNESDHSERNREMRSCISEIFYSFEVNLMKAMKLFGNNDDTYEIFAQAEELTKLKEELLNREEQYDEMAKRYEKSVQSLLKFGKEVCSKPALSIFKRIEKKIKASYHMSEAVGHSSDEGVENRWDELGKWVYEETLYEMAHSDVSSDIEVALNALNENEEKIVLYDSLNEDDLSFDVDNVIEELTDIDYFFDRNESFIEPMIENILREAEDDWRNKF